MNISCSISGIINLDYPSQGLKDLKDAGFSNIHLKEDLFFEGSELEKNMKSVDQVQSLYEKCKEKELTISLLSVGGKHTQEIIPFTLTEIERWNSYLGIMQKEKKIKYLVVTVPEPYNYTEELNSTNLLFYDKLMEIGKNNAMQILLHNQYKDYNGHLIRGFCSDPNRGRQLIDSLNERAKECRFGFCFDVGVATICGQNPYDCLVLLNHRVKGVIIRDSDKQSDNGYLPFTCSKQGVPQTDYLGLIRGLRKIQFQNELLFDIQSTARSFSPILHPQLLHLAKETADYLKWQIELEQRLDAYSKRVLFGAGNMCRNYMKCYGSTHTPLFTCDNNPKLWGTKFSGLIVYSPEQLKSLPKDYCIFICNSYYREIEEQLRSMGIEHPIEYFNDEYMPSFYID